MARPQPAEDAGINRNSGRNVARNAWLLTRHHPCGSESVAASKTASMAVTSLTWGCSVCKAGQMKE